MAFISRRQRFGWHAMLHNVIWEQKARPRSRPSLQRYYLCAWMCAGEFSHRVWRASRWGRLAQQCRLNAQTCRALVYRHSCAVFALAWFYHWIYLPAAGELESEHSSLSLSLSERDTQLILWASKTYVCAWHDRFMACIAFDKINGFGLQASWMDYHE